MSDKEGQENLIEYQLIEVQQHKNEDKNILEEGHSIQNIITDTIQGEQTVLISNYEGLKSDGVFDKVLKYYISFRKNFLQKHSIRIWSGLSIILSFLVLMLYLSLKKKCPYNSDHQCFWQYIFPNLFKWIAIVLFNSIATIIQFHLLISKNIHSAISGYGFLQSVYLFIFDDFKINLRYYMGAINASHLLFCFIFLIFYGMVSLWTTCYKKSKSKCLLGNVVVISFLALSFYFIKVNHACDYWPKGINGELENYQGMCQIPTPTLCWYKITQYWQDISQLLPTCENAQFPKHSKGRIDTYFSPFVNDSRFIAFSNLNSVAEYNRMDDEIQKAVFSQSKGYDSLKSAKSDKYDVVFDRKKQKYHIDVQFNQTLSEERKKKAAEREGKPLSKNILLLFIDAVSRQSMHLKMPKTVEWFEKRTIQNSYKPDHKQTEKQKNNSQSFEFYKYNSYKPYTYDNLQNLFYGKSMTNTSLPEDQKLVSMTEKLQDLGYVTGHSSDQCQTLSLGFDPNSIKIMKSQRYDHETQSFSCDPNFQDPDSTFSLFQGPYSIVRRCLYGKTLADNTLDYARSFLQKYEENQKFMHVEFSYGHEATGEVLNYLDDPLSEFLEEMTDSGLLKDTTVILFNDHGLHMQGLFYLLHLDSVFAEINLPGLFINIPPELNKKYGDLMGANQQSLISIKNLHHFLNHITVGETYQNTDKSLLTIQQNQKYCSDVGIEIENCSCK